MLYQSFCAFLLIIPSIAFADQYRFSPFAQSKQNLPLRKLLTLPQECYINGSGSLLLDRLSSPQRVDGSNKDSSNHLRTLLKQQKGLLSFNAGYTLDKQSSIALKFSSSILPANLITSFVYKQDVYSIDKLVIFAEGGLFVPTVWEAMSDNVSREEIDPADSSSTHRERSRSLHATRSRSRSAAPARSKSKSKRRSLNKVTSKYSSDNASNKNTLASNPLTAYKQQSNLGLIVSINACYPLDPTVYVEGSINLRHLPSKNKVKRSSSALPFGLIGSVQVGIHIVLA